MRRLTDSERRAQTPGFVEEFVTESDAAALIGISRQRLYILRRKDSPIAPWAKRGKTVLYRRAAVDMQRGVLLGTSAAELRKRLASGDVEWGSQDVLRALAEHEATCRDHLSTIGPCSAALELFDLLGDVLSDRVLAERLRSALRLGTTVGRDLAKRETSKIWWRGEVAFPGDPSGAAG